MNKKEYEAFKNLIVISRSTNKKLAYAFSIAAAGFLTILNEIIRRDNQEVTVFISATCIMIFLTHFIYLNKAMKQIDKAVEDLDAKYKSEQ